MEKIEVKIKLGEEELLDIVKMLLSFENQVTYSHDTVLSKLEIQFNGSGSRLRKKLFDWLNIPEQKQNFLERK